MVSTTWRTTRPPLLATSPAPMASWFALRAFSALPRTVEVSSSMLAAVSSSAAACCSVREDKSALPAAISLAALSMDWAATWISPSIARRVMIVLLMSPWSPANEPSNLPSTVVRRSPCASARMDRITVPMFWSRVSIRPLTTSVSAELVPSGCMRREKFPRAVSDMTALSSRRAASAASRLRWPISLSR